MKSLKFMMEESWRDDHNEIYSHSYKTRRILFHYASDNHNNRIVKNRSLYGKSESIRALFDL